MQKRCTLMCRTWGAALKTESQGHCTGYIDTVLSREDTVVAPQGTPRRWERVAGCIPTRTSAEVRKLCGSPLGTWLMACQGGGSKLRPRYERGASVKVLADDKSTYRCPVRPHGKHALRGQKR